MAGGPAGGPRQAPGTARLRLSETERDARATDLLAEALQFYGPRRPEEFAGLLGIGLDRLKLGLEDLRDSDAVIEGSLIKDGPERLVCDPDNFESLLRMERAAAVPQVEAKPASDLALFLAQVQGLVRRPGTAAPEEMTFDAVQRLAGYALPAPLWEAEVLPARVPGYKSPMLDFALRQADLRWVGGSGGQVRFAFESDLDILRPDEAEARRETEPGPPGAAGLFPDADARYDFGSLLRRAGGDLDKLEEDLWAAVWSGRITNDSWSALRRGLETGFRVGAVIDRQKRSLEYAPRRGALHLSAWREAQAYPGNWLRLPSPSDAAFDLIGTEERRKERVRMLLDRYGILFRELLAREQPPFRWPDVFRTLRIMELSGEVLAGYFFEGIAGPQFMSAQALRLFRGGLAGDAVFWISAVDPASVCGLGVEGLRGVFPKRVEGAHVVFKGERPVVISQRSGRALTILVPPDDPELPGFLGLFRHLLTRDFDPMRRVVIETVNDGPAPDSPYLAVFGRLFEVVRDRTQVSLFRTLAV